MIKPIRIEAGLTPEGLQQAAGEIYVKGFNGALDDAKRKKDARECADNGRVRMDNELSNCHDCCVAPGEFHKEGCDVELCPNCGGQRISCDCEADELPRIPWTGLWPGVKECREFGWYSKMVIGEGWVKCDKDAPEAREDLNRLYTDAMWNKVHKRFIRKRTW